MQETGDRVRYLIDRHWNDFWELGLLAYEIQFRSLISEERKAAVVERLIELAVQADRRHERAPDFEFPSTDITETRRRKVGRLGDVDWREHGLLRMSGYHVGKTKGKPEGLRQRILNYIFLEDTLEDVEDTAYADEWGEPKSSARLQKLTHTIASLVRNAKRNPHDTADAIRDWENDLEYLRETFYDRWGDFPWPSVEVE